MAHVRITVSAFYKTKLIASNPQGGEYSWYINDGDICEIISQDKQSGVYLLKHPLHPNEPFHCAAPWAKVIDDGSPAPVPARAQGKPATCSCNMNQLWKAGCICGHIDKYVLKLRG